MWLWLVVGAIVVYLLLQLFRLLRADGDLQVLGSSLKPDYFKDRVVWVTGASSGSEWVGVYLRGGGCQWHGRAEYASQLSVVYPKLSEVG